MYRMLEMSVPLKASCDLEKILFVGLKDLFQGR